MMRILFTGVGKRIELIQAFRSAAQRMDLELKIYGSDLLGDAPALAFCDCVRRMVSMRDPGYVDALLELCRRDGIDLVIPTIDTDLLVLAEHRERFAVHGVRLLISAPEMVRICRDKNLTSRFFVDCGLRAPLPVHDCGAYAGGFPAFIKPKDGSGSVNAFRADDRETLRLYAERIGDYVIQPFVQGREYTIDILCDWEGEPVSIVPRERLSVRSGEVVKTRICMDETMIAEAERLCSVFRPRGPITVQLIRDAEGVDWFIEINPRFGGGAPLSMKAGSGAAEAILRMTRGEKLSRVRGIADGASFSRFDQSVFVEEGRGRRLSGVIFDLDDTLYNEIDYIRSGFRAVSDRLGGGFEERLLGFFEAGTAPIDALLRELGRQEEKAALLAVYRAHRPDIRLNAGAEALLRSLRAKGLRLGIVTDGRPEGQRNKLAALGLESLVDDIIITDELGGAQFRKPCDIAFRILQTRWRLPAAEIAYVGDNPVKDFQGPKQLGMLPIWYRNPDGLYTGAEAPALTSVGRLDELEAFF